MPSEISSSRYYISCRILLFLDALGRKIEFGLFILFILLFCYFHYRLESSNQTITPRGLLISQLPVDSQLGILFIIILRSIHSIFLHNSLSSILTCIYSFIHLFICSLSSNSFLFIVFTRSPLYGGSSHSGCLFFGIPLVPRSTYWPRGEEWIWKDNGRISSKSFSEKSFPFILSFPLSFPSSSLGWTRRSLHISPSSWSSHQSDHSNRRRPNSWRTSRSHWTGNHPVLPAILSQSACCQTCSRITSTIQIFPRVCNDNDDNDYWIFLHSHLVYFRKMLSTASPQSLILLLPPLIHRITH